MNRGGSITWPASRLGEAVDALLGRTRLSRSAADIRNPGASVTSDLAALNRWMDAVAAGVGLEAEPANIHYSEFEEYLVTAAPALMRVSIDGEAPFLALLDARGTKARVLGPDFAIHTFSIAGL